LVDAETVPALSERSLKPVFLSCIPEFCKMLKSCSEYCWREYKEENPAAKEKVAEVTLEKKLQPGIKVVDVPAIIKIDM